MKEKRMYCSDLGDGRYLNPVMYGDYSNPAILKDGEDYYMLHAGQQLVWHSRDLLHWEPLYKFPYSKEMGFGANDICKVGDTYYLYNFSPYIRSENDYKSSNVLVAISKDIRNGIWEGPFYVGPAFNLLNDRELIDPAHYMDLEGNRWLFMSDNVIFPLSKDGMHFTGPGKRIIPDEVLPDDWEVQGIYTEGPRMIYKDGYCYLTVAVGGTEGPPTSHGIFEYRAKDVWNGPWERCPYNPIIRVQSRHETWHSCGHGQLIQDPNNSWFIFYHGTLKDRANHGMMCLMEPVEWTNDGWYVIPEWSRRDKPLPAPGGGTAVVHGYPTKVQFPMIDELPGQWLYTGDIQKRIEMHSTALSIKGSGSSLHDCGGVMCYNLIYKNYEMITEITVGTGAGAGIALYYNPIHSIGFALSDGYIKVFDCGKQISNRAYNEIQYSGDHIFLKMTVRNNVVSLWLSLDGEVYQKLVPSFNIEYITYMAHLERDLDGTLMYPSIFTYGTGIARFHSFEIKELIID